MKPAIGEALHALYEPIRAELELEGQTGRGAGSAAGMLEATELFRIDITRDNATELNFCFRDDAPGADDSMFRVGIVDGRPTPLGVDD